MWPVDKLNAWKKSRLAEIATYITMGGIRSGVTFDQEKTFQSCFLHSNSRLPLFKVCVIQSVLTTDETSGIGDAPPVR